MSYCVNCGVELDDSAKKCALCGVSVVNPAKFNKPEADSVAPFPQNEHIPSGIKRRFVAYVISMTILIPNIVCFLINVLFRQNGFWALYVNSTSFLVWIVFVLPFFTKKLHPYLMWLFNTLAVCAYVFFFFAMGHEKETTGWYYYCALPIILLTSVFALAYMIWTRRKKRHIVLKTIFIMSEAALASLIFGGIIDISLDLEIWIGVSFIIFASCAALIGFLIYCYSSKHMRRWLSKRFFI